MKKIIQFFIIVLFLVGIVSAELIKIDFNVHLNSKIVAAGDEVFGEISIVNKEFPQGDITVKYSIINKEGSIIDEKTETLLLVTRVSYIKSFVLPLKTKEGLYTFSVKASYKGEIIGTASDSFYVSKKAFLSLENILIIVIILIAIILLFVIYELRSLKKKMKINEGILIKEKLIKLKGGKK